MCLTSPNVLSLLLLLPFSAQELSQEIKAFLTGVDPILGHQLSAREHARCGLLLLRSLPPARAAVLDHLRGVFDESVQAESWWPRIGSTPVRKALISWDSS